MFEISELPRRQLRASQLLAPASWLALTLAVLPIGLLQLVGAGRLDSATTTVSDYVSLPGGALLLSLSALSLAAGVVLVPLALARAGLRVTVGAWLCFAAGSAGLFASVLFPTNVIGQPTGLSAVLHRYAAGLFFLALPIACWLLARADQLSRASRRGSVLSAGLGILFLISQVPLVFPGFAGAHLIWVLDPRGLVERLLLGADIALLAVLVRQVRAVRG